MLIYKDVISGDELCSDTFPMKCVDDIVYEFEGRTITVKHGISDALFGGNASEEACDGDEAADGEESYIDIVYGNRLVEMSFDKKGYTKYIKDYMKSILEKLTPERAEIFKVNAQKYVMSILKKFDEFRFFTGESMNPEGMIILCNYREDQITPYFVMFKDGLEEEKC